MKLLLKILAPMSLVLFLAVSTNAQSTVSAKKSCEPKNCDVTKCNPAMCDALVKAGLCTKEEAAACKAKMAKVSTTTKGTKVAAASVDRTELSTTTAPKSVKKSCQPAACAKVCSSKKAVNKD